MFMEVEKPTKLNFSYRTLLFITYCIVNILTKYVRNIKNVIGIPRKII